MALSQNNLEYIKNQLELGQITVDQANVEMVKMARVKLITTRVPAQVRKAFNAAVKAGELAHKSKDGRKPEVYFHPSFEYLANQARASAELDTLRAIAGICI